MPKPTSVGGFRRPSSLKNIQCRVDRTAKVCGGYHVTAGLEALYLNPDKSSATPNARSNDWRPLRRGSHIVS